jgi:hypothetical protein
VTSREVPPRWSIPIDTDKNKNTAEGYAFIDVSNVSFTK